MAGSRPKRALACVVGGFELVRALGMAGIRSIVVGPGSERVRMSRYAVRAPDPGPGRLGDVLTRVATMADQPPVLFTELDEVLLQLSAERDRVTAGFRILLPSHDLLLELTDKERFQRLAEELELPVPRGRRLRPALGEPADIDLRYPLVIKPIPFRNARWQTAFDDAKGVRVADARQLAQLWPLLAHTGLEFMAQELVPGEETQVVSYHAYVGAGGAVLGEFTGRKIRTHPAEFGMSSALVTTDDEPLARAGRDILGRIGLLGPAKLDFKLDASGGLHLLEVNPRFTLWTHPGAVAGVNLPAIAYADLTGAPLPRPARARAGVRWVKPRSDLAAAREKGIPLHRWLSWAIRCETSPAFAWNDPAPALRRLLAR